MRDPSRVLISEDTDLWQGIFARLLAGKPFEVHQAKDLPTTLSELDRYFFNVVIVDLALDPSDESRLDGIDTMRRISRLAEGTQAIVLTGRGSVELAVSALRDFQVYHFLEKERFKEGNFIEALGEASTKAYRLAVGPGHSQPPEALVGPVNWHQFSSVLHVGQEDLELSIHALVRASLPIRFRGKTLNLVFAPNRDALCVEFWSKWFGCAVRLMVGKEGGFPLPPESRILEGHKRRGLASVIAAVETPFDCFVG